MGRWFKAGVVTMLVDLLGYYTGKALFPEVDEKTVLMIAFVIGGFVFFQIMESTKN